jgi:hypothetical protein
VKRRGIGRVSHPGAPRGLASGAIRLLHGRHAPDLRASQVDRAMLQDVYDRLLLHRLEPRWVAHEVHVDVFGRRFMLADRPGGVSMRTLAVTTQVAFDDPEDALAAMGLGRLDATG